MISYNIIDQVAIDEEIKLYIMTCNTHDNVVKDVPDKLNIIHETQVGNSTFLWAPLYFECHAPQQKMLFELCILCAKKGRSGDSGLRLLNKNRLRIQHLESLISFRDYNSP